MSANCGYKDLATSIVVMAIEDFKKAAASYKKGKNRDLSTKTMTEVINFIKSDWYLQLSNLNPEIVIEKLKEGLEDDS